MPTYMWKKDCNKRFVDFGHGMVGILYFLLVSRFGTDKNMVECFNPDNDFGPLQLKYFVVAYMKLLGNTTPENTFSKCIVSSLQ